MARSKLRDGSPKPHTWRGQYSEMLQAIIYRMWSRLLPVGNQSACLVCECIANGLGQGNALRNTLVYINICTIRFYRESTQLNRNTVCNMLVHNQYHCSDTDTSVGKVGVLACWEHAQLTLKFHPFHQDEEIYVAAWPPVFARDGSPGLRSVSKEGETATISTPIFSR